MDEKHADNVRKAFLKNLKKAVQNIAPLQPSTRSIPSLPR
jgi:hypothetical protein